MGIQTGVKPRNFEALVPRIYELGGHLPKSMIDFHNVSACPPAFIPADPTNINDMLQILVEAERCAVRGYTEICNMTFGKDHRTYDLSLAILHEEIEHEAWFSEPWRGPERPCAAQIGREFALCWQVPRSALRTRAREND